MNKKNKNISKHKAASHSHVSLLPSSSLPYVTKHLAANGRLDPSFTKEEQENFIRELRLGFNEMMNDLKVSKEDDYQDLITIQNPHEYSSRLYNIALPSKFDYFIASDDNHIPNTEEDNNECIKNLKAMDDKKK